MTRLNETKNIYQPSEADIQKTLFQWMRLNQNKYPELELAYAVPNGGSRHKLEAVSLKAQGVKKGVPDICIPVPKGAYAGLYIELKRDKGGRTSPEQKWWIEKLTEQGYKAVVCAGFEQAKETISDYMER